MAIDQYIVDDLYFVPCSRWFRRSHPEKFSKRIFINFFSLHQPGCLGVNNPAAEGAAGPPPFATVVLWVCGGGAGTLKLLSGCGERCGCAERSVSEEPDIIWAPELAVSYPAVVLGLEGSGDARD